MRNGKPSLGAIKHFVAHCKPSAMLRRLRKHSGDVSSADKPKLLAVRHLWGRRLCFYETGEHTVDGLSPDEAFDSEILRFAHASLLIREGVGDKRILYVDAMQEPIEVWIYGKPAVEFVRRAKQAVRNGTIEQECVIDGAPGSPILAVRDSDHG